MLTYYGQAKTKASKEAAKLNKKSRKFRYIVQYVGKGKILKSGYYLVKSRI